MNKRTGKIIEITNPHRLIFNVEFTSLNLTKCAKPAIVTIRFSAKNTITENVNIPNIDIDVDGGIALPMLRINSIVVINIDVFNPNRSPTDGASLRLNRNEIADTMQKIISGKRLDIAADAIILS